MSLSAYKEEINGFKVLHFGDVQGFIKEDYKNTVLAKRGEITWQEYARRRIKLAGKELLE